MLSHITLGTTDLARRRAFYVPLMAAPGWRLKFGETRWTGWMPDTADRPLMIVTLPENDAPATAGNGKMVAFDLADRDGVRRVGHGPADQGAEHVAE